MDDKDLELEKIVTIGLPKPRPKAQLVGAPKIVNVGVVPKHLLPGVGRTRPAKYPFRELQVGSYFDLDLATAAKAKKVAATWESNERRMARVKRESRVGRIFRIETIDQKDGSQIGRFWRTH